MIMEIKSTDEWKAGTGAIALCMICGGEYPAGTQTCPDCNVSLSVVRRCPSCHRVVSAHHTRCVHCRTNFTEEIPKELLRAEAPVITVRQPLDERLRKYRAVAVSVLAFLVVLGTGLYILHRINNTNTPAPVIAKSSTLHATELHRSPSFGSASAGKLMPGTALGVTGFRHGDQGLWMKLAWNNATAYAPAFDLTAPLAVDAEQGAYALKLYLSELDASDSVDPAVKAVNYYAQTFPASPHRDELRWVLAERLRSLSAGGGQKAAALRSQANEQYQQLAATTGGYAGNARAALAKTPPPSFQERAGTGHKKAARRGDGLQIVDDAGTHNLTVTSVPHEVMVLTKTEVIVHAGKLSQSSEGTIIPGRVAYNVKANGIVAIPAGSLCQLKVTGTDSSQDISLRLTSIEINHRVYPVRSTSTEISSAAKRHIADNALTFHLDAPLVLPR